MNSIRPSKRFHSSTNVELDRLSKTVLKEQFLFAPDICTSENEITPLSSQSTIDM